MRIGTENQDLLCELSFSHLIQVLDQGGSPGLELENPDLSCQDICQHSHK